MKSKFGFLVRKQTKIDNGNGTYQYEYAGSHLYLTEVEVGDYDAIANQVELAWGDDWEAYEVINVSYDLCGGYYQSDRHHQYTNWNKDPINPKNRPPKTVEEIRQANPGFDPAVLEFDE